MSKSLLTGIRERGFVRISAYWGETSAQYLDPDSGEPAGLVGLVGELLAHDLGVKPEFVNMVWEDHIDALLSDQVDISIKHTNTPERAFNVEFTIESILCEEGRIVILSSNDLKKEAKPTMIWNYLRKNINKYNTNGVIISISHDVMKYFKSNATEGHLTKESFRHAIKRLRENPPK